MYHRRKRTVQIMQYLCLAAKICSDMFTYRVSVNSILIQQNHVSVNKYEFNRSKTRSVKIFYIQLFKMFNYLFTGTTRLKK